MCQKQFILRKIVSSAQPNSPETVTSTLHSLIIIFICLSRLQCYIYEFLIELKQIAE